MPTTIPSITSSTRPGSPSTGDAYFETDTNKYIIYDGANWRTYDSDGASVSFPSNSYAIELDGTNDYINISGASSLLNSATAFSVSLWYKQDAYGGVLIGSGTGNNDGFWLQAFTNGNFYAIIRNTGNTTLATSVPALNTWVHVAVTYNAGTINLYLTPAGGSTSTTTLTGGPSSTSATGGSNLSIGKNPWGTPYNFDGKIDEVAIWNREITSSEVFNIISNKDYLNISAIWRLENTADATLGGSGYNGTNNGGTFVSGTGNTPY